MGDEELVAELEAEIERLRAALAIANRRLTAIQDGQAFRPRLHARAGLMEIKAVLTPSEPV